MCYLKLEGGGADCTIRIRLQFLAASVGPSLTTLYAVG
jgi:hypothetical protein